MSTKGGVRMFTQRVKAAWLCLKVSLHVGYALMKLEKPKWKMKKKEFVLLGEWTLWPSHFYLKIHIQSCNAVAVFKVTNTP